MIFAVTLLWPVVGSALMPGEDNFIYLKERKKQNSSFCENEESFFSFLVSFLVE